MPNLLLCISATSGGGNALKIGPKVAKIFSQNGWNVKIKLTNMDDDLSAIAKKSSFEYIAVLGGDGYISAVADGVIKAGKVLIPLPAGRGNDFCRKLGIDKDVLSHLENINNFVTENIDVAVAKDGLGREKTILGIMSLGIDSVANQYANANRFLKGMPVYIWGFVKAIKNFKPLTYTLIADGEEIVVTSWSVLVSVTGIYGGGVKILPVSNIKDGLIDVLTIENLSLLGLLRLVPKIIKGEHLTHPSMIVRQVEEISVKCDTNFLPYSDGDPTGILPIEVSVRKGVLQVMH